MALFKRVGYDYIRIGTVGRDKNVPGAPLRRLCPAKIFYFRAELLNLG